MNTSLNGTDSLLNLPGKMLVRVWQEDQEGLVDETILEAGDFTQVAPGQGPNLKV